MDAADRTLAIDRIPDREAKRCAGCKRWKARDLFTAHSGNSDGLQSRCRDCNRLSEYTRYHEKGGRETKAEYHAREETREQRREWQRANPERHREAQRKYRESVRGRIMKQRGELRRLIRGQEPGPRRDRLEASLAAVEREIARIDAARRAVADAELPELIHPLIDPAKHYAAPKKTRPYGANPARGVFLAGGRYLVQIRAGGKMRHGGRYDDLESAIAASNEMGRRLLGIEHYAAKGPRRDKTS